MSREAELYKDKIEVSLDGRQIFYLFFGGAVIVGVVFVVASAVVAALLLRPEPALGAHGHGEPAGEPASETA